MHDVFVEMQPINITRHRDGNKPVQHSPGPPARAPCRCHFRDMTFLGAVMEGGHTPSSHQNDGLAPTTAVRGTSIIRLSMTQDGLYFSTPSGRARPEVLWGLVRARGFVRRAFGEPSVGGDDFPAPSRCPEHDNKVSSHSLSGPPFRALLGRARGAVPPSALGLSQNRQPRGVGSCFLLLITMIWPRSGSISRPCGPMP